MIKKNKKTAIGDITPQEARAMVLVQNVLALRHRLYRMASEAAPDHNLKSSELALIVSLGRNGTQSMSDLAKACFFSPPNATYIVSSLEKKGLVKRERSDKSSRVVYVNLTPAGEAVFETAFPQIVAKFRTFFDKRLSLEQMDYLELLLGQLVSD
ncbi:MarR family winged helix-turn-helix transcriptional regulator [Emcibacter nanhaiensis]|nr:MarR family transcriptional regulator [Emcibacter nanhaiensis]